MSEVKYYGIEDSDVVDILSSKRYGYLMVEDEDYSLDGAPESNSLSVYSNIKKSKYKCFCKINKGKEIEGSFCPYCGNGIRESGRPYVVLRTKDQLEIYRDWLTKEKRKKENCEKHFWVRNVEDVTDEIAYNGFYIKKHPDYSNGILIFKVKITVSFKKGIDELKTKIENYVEIVPGIKYAGYKTVKKGYQEIDIFEAFNLNSNTKRYNASIVWGKYSGMIDFLLGNMEFSKQTALLEMFNMTDTALGRNSFFLIYMYLYTRYPAIEFLVKMGYFDLIRQTINKVSSKGNKAEMYYECDKLNKIFNEGATKGSIALCFPKYIGDYLNLGEADVYKYFLWSAFYSYDKISKENFEKYVSSIEYKKLFDSCHYYSVSKLSNLLKYGYTIIKVTNYIVKQSEKYDTDCNTILDYISDYCEMCEVLGTEIQLYPDNPQSVHDNLVEIYESNKLSAFDVHIQRKYNVLNNMEIKSNDELTVVYPSCSKDFIDEGNMQCNCVASYARRVSSNECIVFFIRKKDEPENSYITCEYRDGHLAQIRARYNSSVSDKNAVEYANEICEKISKIEAKLNLK